VNCYSCVFKHIEKADLEDEYTIIRTILMLEVLWVLYAQEKELNDLHTKGPPYLNDKLIDLWPHATASAFRRRATTIALSHRHVMRLVRTRSLPVQTRNLQDSKHYTKLTDSEKHNYQDTWLKTNLVELKNEVLVTKPFRREPP
jgi:pantothenate kinase